MDGLNIAFLSDWDCAFSGTCIPELRKMLSSVTTGVFRDLAEKSVEKK